MEKAIYAGSFDPITNGHLWMIEQGLEIFDKVIVTVAINPDKNYTFSLDERVAMVRDSTFNLPNIQVDCLENGYIVNYAESKGANYLLRGIRNAEDAKYERAMADFNLNLNPKIKTIFLKSPSELANISSSEVRKLARQEKYSEIRNYVPEPVYRKFMEKYEHAIAR